jgi:glycerophosphoryl diester phosphodiesterase
MNRVANPPAPTPLLPLRQLIGLVWHDFWHAFTPLVLFEAAYKALTALLLLPGLAWVLSALVQATGRTVVTNTDLVAFLLSPAGLFYAALFGVASLGLWLLEHAGVMTVVVLKHFGYNAGLKRTAVVVGSAAARIFRLGLALLGAAVAGLAPFAGLALLTQSLLLSEHDINYYLAARPRELYVAAGIGAVLGLTALALAGYLYVRWAFSLAILIFEGRQPIPALHESARRVRGAGWRVGAILGGWHLLGLLLTAGTVFAFRAFSAWTLDGVGTRPAVVLPLVAFLLVCKVLLAACLSFLVVSVHCLLLLRLYGDRSVRLGAIQPGAWVPEVIAEAPPRPWLVRRWGLGALGCAGGILVVCVVIARGFEAPRVVEVTAHRGHSRAAPENTLSAIQAAIDSQADYAEIDVHLCACGEVAVLHDFDLARVSRKVNRNKIYRVRYADLRDLDVGSHFDRSFAFERVATLRQAIAVARGQNGRGTIKLNIELKFAQDDPHPPRRDKPGRRDYRLAQRVADVLREEQFEDRCVVMSLNLEGVRKVKGHNPKVRTGHIVTLARGDITRADVDVLSVHSALVSDELLRQARRRGKEVHVWTVNDRRQMRRLIEHGVRNVITDDPDLLVRVRQERAALSDVDHVLLAYRSLLDF